MQQHHSGYAVVMFRQDNIRETVDRFKWMPFDEALALVQRLELDLVHTGLQYEYGYDCWNCQYSDGRSVTVRIEIHNSLGQAVLSGKKEL